MNLVEVEDRIVVPFLWGNKDLGRAEFSIELDYKRGKLLGFYVFPTQQRNMPDYWHVSSPSFGEVSISSFDGLEEPRVWLVGACKQHKMPFIRLYVPPNSTHLEISGYGLSFWRR